MPLVPAICTQCKAKLEIDSSQEAAVCPYCRTPFVTENAINNYNTTNVTNIGNLHADVVNVADDQSRDNRVKSGETFIRMNDYDSAEKVFSKLSEECPYDYRGWWGLIEVYSKNFTDLSISRTELLNIETLYNKACTVATEEERDSMDLKYKIYYSTVKTELDTLMNDTNKKIEQLTEEFDRHKNDLESRMEDLSELEKQLKRPRKKVVVVLVCAVLLLFMLTGISNPVFIVLFAIIAVLIFYVVVRLSDEAYDKKIKYLKEEILLLRVQLNTLIQEHDTEIAPLLLIISKVGYNNEK